MDIWETEPVSVRVAALAVLQARLLERFRNDQRFANVRQTGTITAIDIKTADAGYFAHVCLSETMLKMRPNPHGR